MSTFTGFSEEDLQRIKSGETRPNNDFPDSTVFVNHQNIIKPAKLGYLSKSQQYKLKNITIRKEVSDDSFDGIEFEKCRLSIKSPQHNNNNNSEALSHEDQNENITVIKPNEDGETESDDSLEKTDVEEANSSNVVKNDSSEEVNSSNEVRKYSSDVTPDIVRGMDLTEDELAAHRAKLEELQLKQRLMEEQNKKRKEMLSKALADRTRQTVEEVQKLEKIKKELQVLDGQFSQDINVLRKKIDQACLTYSEAEKHYLKVEKEFLQAKIQLQKEKDKKELLTEHLCALITHNETRKAQKLETLMLELATDRKSEINDMSKPVDDDKDENPVIIDGVDERTGKMVEIKSDS